MKLIILSGRSGSGKSTALQALEDLDFYCIDNLPVALLPALCEQLQTDPPNGKRGVAISIDARNSPSGLRKFPEVVEHLNESPLPFEILYLDASVPTLLKRFSATRRKHPLTDSQHGLSEAIAQEQQLLEPLANLADLTIDTTRLTLYELRDLIKSRVAEKSSQEIALLFQSFGFKHGVPLDADLVYDVRCLPNPYWVPELRRFTGRDTEIVDYLAGQPEVIEMEKDITAYLEKWLPHFEENNRSYLTVAIGCTGGQHRSVFLAERLAVHFRQSMDNVLVKHRELS